ncbi:MAG: 6,7-dimethyl-8-ribityllumazine synthase [Candidatus Zixiibacteriota bacterium]
MAKEIKGEFDGRGLRFGIVVSRFNDFLTDQLVKGALDCLERHAVNHDDIRIVHVPGAFEIPLAAQELASSGKVDAVLCLGVIIRGETPHFDYVAGQASAGIMKVSLETKIPVIFGIVTTENLQQAIDRCGSKAGNKGWDCAMAGIEMARVLKKVSGA